jgi:hypothetical protein
MDALINKTVRFSKEEIAGLRAMAEKEGRKFGELVRIAVDQLLGLKNGKKKSQTMKLIAVVIALFIAGWVGSCIGHWANRHVEPIKIVMTH